MATRLMKGNEALAEGAIAAGCRCYFGYPITPQNEVCAYMSRRMPQVGGVFIQAESELAAINMVYGAAATGVLAMTSSSSPGISLKQEGISYLAGSELPAVIANVCRGGPGLGNISGAQGDYFQATKGGGHGDYRLFVVAPASVQETADLTRVAFRVADKYRQPVLILFDGLLGQMLEPVTIDQKPLTFLPKTWALTGAKGRKANCIKSLYLGEEELEKHNWRLHQKYCQMEATETMAESLYLTDAQLVVVAYGSMARIAKSAVAQARAENMKVGLIRPITLSPFPNKLIASVASRCRFLTLELSTGQMVEDVKLAVAGSNEVYFYGRPGGSLPLVEEILAEIRGYYNHQLSRKYFKVG